jgi:hypothetical protein
MVLADDVGQPLQPQPVGQVMQRLLFEQRVTPSSSPSRKRGSRAAAMARPPGTPPYRSPHHSRASAGLSGESEAVAKPRSCATREDPRGRTCSGHPRFRLRDRGWLKTWMPGTSPGKGLLEAKFRAKCTHQLPLNFPRTALRASGNPEVLVACPGRPLSRGRRLGGLDAFPHMPFRGNDEYRRDIPGQAASWCAAKSQFTSLSSQALT